MICALIWSRPPVRDRRNHIPPESIRSCPPVHDIIIKFGNASLYGVNATNGGPHRYRYGSRSVKSTMPWPEHPKFLQPNKNDTWNDFQKLHRGKIVTTTAWREARDALHKEFREYLARGGIAQCRLLFDIVRVPLLFNIGVARHLLG